MGMEKAVLNKYLELSPDQYICLLSLQKLLIINDIANTPVGKSKAEPGQQVRDLKEKWLAEWEKSVCEAVKLKELTRSEGEIIAEMQSFPVRTVVLFLLEAHSFVPYFPVSERGSGVPKKEAFTDEARKVWNARLDAFIILAKFERKSFETVRSTYATAVKEITGTDWRSIARNLTIIAGSAVVLGVTGGVAAPWIGGLIGSTLLGLSGAAATSAGLALLGGGALALGGAGIAGGTAVLVGGSALLGSMLGKAFTTEAEAEDLGGNLAAFDTNFLIVQAAKIETVCKCAVENDDRDEFVRAVLKNYRSNLVKLKQMIDLDQSLKVKYPNLSLETIQRNRRIQENALMRIREIV
jgi:hypothetical protein